MIIGFDKEGLKMNNKKFNPLKLSVKGYGLDMDSISKDTKPLDTLKELYAIKNGSSTRSTIDKIDNLESILS